MDLIFKTSLPRSFGFFQGLFSNLNPIQFITRNQKDERCQYKIKLNNPNVAENGDLINDIIDYLHKSDNISDFDVIMHVKK